MSTAAIRTEFKNVSAGVIGAVVFDSKGERRGIPVKPGDTVWLTEPEEIATANAPRKDSDNPFAQGWLVVETRASEVINRRPIGSREQVGPTAVAGSEEPAAGSGDTDLDKGNEPVPPPTEVRPATEEVGAPPLPEGDPAHGVRPPGEEVGTPQVVASGARPPAPPRGTTVQSRNAAAKEAPEPGVAKAVVVGQGGPQYVEER